MSYELCGSHIVQPNELKTEKGPTAKCEMSWAKTGCLHIQSTSFSSFVIFSCGDLKNSGAFLRAFRLDGRAKLCFI